jgi:hypothetical protein
VKHHTYPYAKGHEFEGIIHDLTVECGGNVHEKGIVNITSSIDDHNRAFQVANHGWNDHWYSDSAPNSWICFDFKEQKVALSHYTLKSVSGRVCPMVWTMEGSDDGTNWTTLDERNTRVLTTGSVVETFECAQNRSKLFRYIRLRQTGKSGECSDFLLLANVELFGDLGE